jgi:uncharacterized Zn-binding protein involved in type VI secretion
LSNPAARKGDTDDKGYTITGAVSDNVIINGQPAAVKGSTMNDGESIVGAVSATVTINGRPAAVKGSTTSAHQKDAPQKGVGTINSGSDTVTIG